MSHFWLEVKLVALRVQELRLESPFTSELPADPDESNSLRQARSPCMINSLSPCAFTRRLAHSNTLGTSLAAWNDTCLCVGVCK